MSDKVNFGAAERQGEPARAGRWSSLRSGRCLTCATGTQRPGAEGGLGRIKERLDKVRALIQEPEFLEGKGLSNEVNIRIFCYEPENEMVVRHFVNRSVLRLPFDRL